MAGKIAVASQIFGYLKRAVTNLTVPQSQLESWDANDANNATEKQIQNCPRAELSGSSQQKRKACFSPPRGQKKQNVMGSKRFCSTKNKSWQTVREDEKLDNLEEYWQDQISPLFHQLLWTLKYLKYNPFKTDEEMLEMMGSLSEGLEKIAKYSRLTLTDQDFRRFVRIADTLFMMVKSCEEENSLHTLIQMNKTIENLFDSFLNSFHEESNAEAHMKSYSFISAIINQVDDAKIMERLTDKLVLRLYSTTTVLWKACVSGKDGTVQLVLPEDFNVFFFYCHLLEVVIASAPAAAQQLLKRSVHQSLSFLQDDAGSLFQLLPNLGFILYATILATGSHMMVETSSSSNLNIETQASALDRVNANLIQHETHLFLF